MPGSHGAGEAPLPFQKTLPGSGYGDWILGAESRPANCSCLKRVCVTGGKPHIHHLQTCPAKDYRR